MTGAEGDGDRAPDLAPGGAHGDGAGARSGGDPSGAGQGALHGEAEAPMGAGGSVRAELPDSDPSDDASDPGASGSSVAFLEQALWRRLSSPDLEAAAQAWLLLHARQSPGVRLGVVVLSAPDGALTPVAVFPEGREPSRRLTRAAEAAVARRAGVAQGEQGRAIAWPILLGEQVAGVAALELDASADARAAMRQLQWGVGWLRDRVRRVAAERTAAGLAQARAGLDLVASALAAENHDDACRSVATELAALAGADRVAVGERTGRRSQVQAISHAASFGQRMNLVRLLSSAMDESLDQRSAVMWPAPAEGPLLATRAHEQLARATAAEHILTLPLMARDHFVGAITFERPRGAPFDQATVDLLDAAVGLLGPVLEERRRNDRWLLGKAGEVAGAHLRRIVGPRYAKRKLALICAAALVALFWLWTDEWRVTADAALAPAQQRAIVAQFDGYIREAPARAGDEVREGDLLVAFDDRELVLERLRWSTERARLTLEYEKALAERDRAAARIVETQAEQADAQIRLVDEQIARAALLAPFDGLVVSGDLSQSIGSAVGRGDLLFEIAPDDAWRVVLQVDERVIDQVAPGQQGELVVASLPGEAFPITVEKVTPVAAPHEGRNAFRVEARLDASSDRLRPGMEGAAKLSVGERRMIWIWTRPLLDWARLALWRWAP
ncbi:efflux RND transporter periplasmic adaptor subunit [Albimonas sp. CAU 1670]|uniref:HlyD family efflux transporter periplasmic adaptor subunit n=1 Tax=Albimonas sp. CAU 1670 TaxID=3032599 RepID=UPI0023D9B34C|nr:HlyD family efflux transporter periplasmic adaptor subunit [Albimonas sp. CAU 1670]MDF2234974.1 efflux RND transporter periplasmic adaptor subunit [Albimonas sp. CAU 1670]